MFQTEFLDGVQTRTMEEFTVIGWHVPLAIAGHGASLSATDAGGIAVPARGARV